MELKDDDGVRRLSEAFGKVLNSQGHAFQHSVIRAAEELYRESRSRWIFEVAELPVNLHGKDTRIDIIMRKQDTRIYLIGECKRANPALSTGVLRELHMFAGIFPSMIPLTISRAISRRPRHLEQLLDCHTKLNKSFRI